MAILISGRDFLVKQGIASIVDRMGKATLSETSNADPEMFIGLFDDGKDSLLKDVPEMLQRCPVLLVGDRFDSTDVRELMEKGVKCIVTKRCSEQEIENAITAALDGNRFYCSKVLEVIASPDADAPNPINKLSRREREVLKLVLEGQTSSEIAENLFVSLHTVNSHRKNILKKFDLKSPVELFIYAIEHRINDSL